MGCINDGDWQNGADETSCGPLINSGKRFFFRLASDSVKLFNLLRYKERILLTSNAMIMTGMSLEINGLCSELQRSKELQMIVAKHRNHFGGGSVARC